MVIGDMNSDFSTHNGQCLQNFTSANNFELHINNPTRITPNSATILDQIITNFPNCFGRVNIDPPLPGCDHNVISIACSFEITKPIVYKRVMWRFNRTDFADFRNALLHNTWQCIYLNDTDESVHSFSEDLMRIATKTIPNTLATVRAADKPWYNSFLRRLKRKVTRLYNRFKRTRDVQNFEIYKDFVKQYQKEVKKAKTEHAREKYNKLANKAQSNTKKW